MRADKTHKEEADKTIEDENGVDAHFRVASCFCWSGSAFHGQCVRGVCPHDFAGDSMVGVIPTMEPTVKLTGSIGGHMGGL